MVTFFLFIFQDAPLIIIIIITATLVLIYGEGFRLIIIQCIAQVKSIQCLYPTCTFISAYVPSACSRELNVNHPSSKMYLGTFLGTFSQLFIYENIRGQYCSPMNTFIRLQRCKSTSSLIFCTFINNS